MSIQNLFLPLLKASQVAIALNISRAHAYRLMQIGEIPTVEIGGSKRVCTEDLQRYIEEHKSKMARQLYNDSGKPAR